MSIEKYEIDSFKKESLPYEFTILPNIVIQNFTNEALALWVHLMSLPSDWNVNREYLMRKFSIGRDKLNRYLSTLLKNHLLEYLWISDELGRVKSVQIVVKNGMDYYKKIVINQQYESTTLKTRIVDNFSTTLKTHRVENPVSGETAPTKEIVNTKPIKSTKDRERKNRALLTFLPDKNNELLCQRLGLCKEDELSSFGSRHKGSKTQYEFERWLKSSHDYKQRNNAGRNEIRSTILEWGPGHPGWESLHGKRGVAHGSETTRDNVRGNGLRKIESYLPH